MLSRIRAIAALWTTLFLFVSVSPALASGPSDVVLPVPHRTQLDGTDWGLTNCGPASTAMVLESFGIDVPTQELRDRANQLLGVANPETGTRLQDLARIAREYGLSTNGPYGSGEYIRQWSLDEVREEVQQGRPVIAEVRLDLLPNQPYIPIAIDHYIVIVGLSGDDFLFNDPAMRGRAGYLQPMTAEQFRVSWGSSIFPFAAFSTGPALASRVSGSSRGGREAGASGEQFVQAERGILLVDRLFSGTGWNVLAAGSVPSNLGWSGDE